MLKDVRTALVNHYLALGLSVPVQQENGDKKPGEHVRIDFVPADNQAASLGAQGSDRFSGFIQFSRVVAGGTNTADALNDVDAIINQFKRGSRLNYNGVNVVVRSSISSGGFPSDNQYTIPVTVNWYADIPRG